MTQGKYSKNDHPKDCDALDEDFFNNIETKSHQFDFEIGYLVKSPCRDCVDVRRDLPNCVQGCEILDRIQTILSDLIPSEKSCSSTDTYKVPVEALEQI